MTHQLLLAKHVKKTLYVLVVVLYFHNLDIGVMINSHLKVLNAHILIIVSVEGKLKVVVLVAILVLRPQQSLMSKDIASIHQLGTSAINVKKVLLEQGLNHNV